MLSCWASALCFLLQNVYQNQNEMKGVRIPLPGSENIIFETTIRSPWYIPSSQGDSLVLDPEESKQDEDRTNKDSRDQTMINFV